MEPKEYHNLFERERSNFWHVGRREILDETVGRFLRHEKKQRILDIGCGTGGNYGLLSRYGEVVGVDYTEEALKFASNAGFFSLIKASVDALPLNDNSYDLVAALDVLEHVEDDAAALKEIFRVLRPGGFLLLTVPAYKFLWSDHDEVLHHFRRYGKKEILTKLKIVQFEIVLHNRFVMLGVLERLVSKIKHLVFFKGRYSNLKKTHDLDAGVIINNLLLFSLRCEKYLMRFFHLPFGTSILVVARKSRTYLDSNF